MKKSWALRISVVLCALMVLAMGSWWMWRVCYSAGQLRAANEAGDAAKVCRLLGWGAGSGPPCGKQSKIRFRVDFESANV